METRSIEITGSHLTIPQVYDLVVSPRALVRVADSAWEAINKSKAFLDQKLSREIVYGVNTGFGPMASHVISGEALVDLQYNLVRGHAVGMGNPVGEDYVLASMLVRLNTLIKGYSGISPSLVQQFVTFLNNRVIPVVPEHGAVGASGDLVQLAHVALCLIGEGEVFYQGRREATSAVLERLGITRHILQPKEGLALINGTSTMTGIAALMCFNAQRLLSIALRTGALSLELVGGFDDSLSKKLHFLRPHPGQTMVAKRLRGLLATSELLRGRERTFRLNQGDVEIYKLPEVVQEVYSLRCIPQILGPIFDTLVQTWRVVETEMNSVTDNPIVDWEEGHFLHGGNFHGDYVAQAVDQLKIALVKLILLSERRTNFFLNENVNKRFPPFLNLKIPGLTLGLQGLQFVATSTAAQSQTLAFPQWVHSIPTNADNQDVVSMGTDAALLGMKIVENAYVVSAIELITLAQAVDYLGVFENLSDSSRMLMSTLRQFFPKIEDDRVLTKDLAQVLLFLRENSIFDMKWRFKNDEGNEVHAEE